MKQMPDSKLEVAMRHIENTQFDYKALYNGREWIESALQCLKIGEGIGGSKDSHIQSKIIGLKAARVITNSRTKQPKEQLIPHIVGRQLALNLLEHSAEVSDTSSFSEIAENAFNMIDKSYGKNEAYSCLYHFNIDTKQSNESANVDSIIENSKRIARTVLATIYT